MMRPALLWDLCTLPGKCLLAGILSREWHSQLLWLLEMASQQQVSRSLLVNTRKAGWDIFSQRGGERFVGDLLRPRSFAGLLQLVVSATAVNSLSAGFLISAPIYVLKTCPRKSAGPSSGCFHPQGGDDQSKLMLKP